MSVEAIMTRTVVTIGPTATVREAVRLLEDSEVRHLPVVEDQRLLGIVSDRDLREFRTALWREAEVGASAEATRALETPLREVMSSQVVSVDLGEAIEAVISVMLDYKVGAVPVVDRYSDELLGIVSYVDVLRYAREVLSAE